MLGAKNLCLRESCNGRRTCAHGRVVTADCCTGLPCCAFCQNTSLPYCACLCLYTGLPYCACLCLDTGLPYCACLCLDTGLPYCACLCLYTGLPYCACPCLNTGLPYCACLCLYTGLPYCACLCEIFDIRLELFYSRVQSTIRKTMFISLRAVLPAKNDF